MKIVKKLFLALLIASAALSTTAIRCIDNDTLGTAIKYTAITAGLVAAPICASYVNYFYNLYKNEPITTPIKDGTEHDFESNGDSEDYKKVSDQCYETVKNCQTPLGYSSACSDSILKLSHTLLGQRERYWKKVLKKDPENAPLYMRMRLHDPITVPLPATNLQKCEVFPNELCPSMAFTQTQFQYKLRPTKLSDYMVRFSNATKQLFEAGKIKNYSVASYRLDRTAPYSININNLLTEQPSELITMVNHELTHLEQYSNAATLAAYLENNYGYSGINVTALTNKSANKIYKNIENDAMLQTIRTAKQLKLPVYGYDKQPDKSLLTSIAAKKIQSILEENTEYEDYNTEAEADRSICYFMHNPYLINKYYSKMARCYSSRRAPLGYDPNLQASIADYTNKYYKNFPKRRAQHQEEYQKIKPFLHLEKQWQQWENMCRNEHIDKLTRGLAVSTGIVVSSAATAIAATYFKK